MKPRREAKTLKHKADGSVSESKLQFYWYETKPHETAEKLQGELVGAAHRLRFVVQMLGELTDNVKLDSAEMISMLKYNAENYYYRIYEMRERAVSLVAARCLPEPANATENQKTILRKKRNALVKGLKSQNLQHREDALSIVQRETPHLVLSLRRILLILNQDSLLRNLHTHETFLSLGLMTDGAPYDPVDVLNNDMEDPAERAWFEDLLRAQSKKLAEEYRYRAKQAIEAAFDLFDDSRQEFVKTRRTNWILGRLYGLA